MIRVLIADDHTMFADGLAAAFEAVPDISVVAVLHDGSGVADAVAEHLPDVVLMDLEMPQMGGLEAIPTLHGKVPVVVVTMHSDDEQRKLAMSAGAIGLLPKSASLADLAAGVRAAAHGVTLDWSTDSERESALAPHRSPQLDPGAESLTAREIELLALLGQGVSSTEDLADRLFISQKTVKNHLASIFAKLSISDRTQAAVEAIRLGFAKPR